MSDSNKVIRRIEPKPAKPLNGPSKPVSPPTPSWSVRKEHGVKKCW